MTDKIEAIPAREALEDMVAEADTGGRKPTGFSKAYIFAISLATKAERNPKLKRISLKSIPTCNERAAPNTTPK